MVKHVSNKLFKRIFSDIKKLSKWNELYLRCIDLHCSQLVQEIATERGTLPYKRSSKSKSLCYIGWSQNPKLRLALPYSERFSFIHHVFLLMHLRDKKNVIKSCRVLNLLQLLYVKIFCKSVM